MLRSSMVAYAFTSKSNTKTMMLDQKSWIVDREYEKSMVYTSNNQPNNAINDCASGLRFVAPDAGTSQPSAAPCRRIADSFPDGRSPAKG